MAHFPAQLWLFERAFRRGDFAEALTHADALLRTNYLDAEFTRAMFPALAAFTREGAAFAALSEFLASDPPWRSWYLRNLAGNLIDRSRLVALYAALSTSGHPPSADKLAPYVQRLVRDGDYAAARQVWRESLPAAQRSEDGLLYNGDFSVPLGGLPFNWTGVAVPAPTLRSWRTTTAMPCARNSPARAYPAGTSVNCCCCRPAAIA